MARAKQSETDNSGNGSIGNQGADSGASDNPSLFTAGDIVIDPVAISGEQNSGSGGDGSGSVAGEHVRKRRGRKPGSTNKNKNAPLDINGLEAILLSSHALLAGIASPKLKIDNEEAHQLATGISNVARHYDVGATEKTLDWINLFMALGAVYGPRMIAISMDRANKPKKSAQQPNANGSAQPDNLGGVQFPYPPITPGMTQ